MKKLSLFLVVLFTTGMMASSFSQEKSKKEMQEATITGEIIDVKCYLTGMMGGKGDEHKQCAIDCVKGGLPIGILDDKTEKVYTVVPKKGMEGANTALMPFLAQKVKLTGTFVEKGGMKLFVYTNVEESK